MKLAIILPDSTIKINKDYNINVPLINEVIEKDKDYIKIYTMGLLYKDLPYEPYIEYENYKDKIIVYNCYKLKDITIKPFIVGNNVFEVEFYIKDITIREYADRYPMDLNDFFNLKIIKK